jgi:hypothetical protein
MVERCFCSGGSGIRASPKTQTPGSILSEFIESAASALHDDIGVRSSMPPSGAPLWTPAVTEVFNDVVAKRLFLIDLPSACPSAALHETCFVQRRQWRVGRRIISSDGCHRSLVQRYYCSKHETGWQLPCGDLDASCSFVADVIDDFFVTGDFWPGALKLFEDTESYKAVEASLRARTLGTVCASARVHPLRSVLSKLELEVLHASLKLHCQSTPTWEAIKKFLLRWMEKMIAPAVPSLAARLCAAY